jgi:regulator of protease activity HflC (stomatin/prohibitin superfamily)
VSSFLFGLVLILAVTIPISIKIFKEGERLVILRLGRFLRVAGPGLVWILPFADRGIRINLRENIPGWEALSKAEPDEKIKAILLNST